jgi:hypothetical protein
VATQKPQPGEKGTEPGGSTGITLITSLSGTQQECSHQAVHGDAANAATKSMTEDTHSKIAHKTGSSKNKKQHAIACKCIRITVTDSQQIV